MAGTANCIDIILAIILPPLGVFLKFGCGVSIGTRFFPLSLFFRLPFSGSIHRLIDA
uniref:Hydrophobic protein LTI6B n=1 Tax=Aegilops tauschii subsp. strangulata TaxID=200361 RepID=A0A452XXW8_AEGTS